MIQKYQEFTLSLIFNFSHKSYEFQQTPRVKNKCHTLLEVFCEGIPKYSSRTAVEEMQLPNDLPISLDPYCKVIQVSYFIMATIRGCKIKIPITIGTVPLNFDLPIDSAVEDEPPRFLDVVERPRQPDFLISSRKFFIFESKIQFNFS